MAHRWFPFFTNVKQMSMMQNYLLICAVHLFCTTECAAELLLFDLLICWLCSLFSCTNKANKLILLQWPPYVPTIYTLVKHDICLGCLALTFVKLWLIPPVAQYLHGKEETAVMLGFCAQTETFDVSCHYVLKIILYCLFGKIDFLLDLFIFTYKWIVALAFSTLIETTLVSVMPAHVNKHFWRSEGTQLGSSG